jgi:hypothetical protein
MIISHEHKYLFVEVPCTGSTAISHELRENYGGEEILYKHANYTEFRHKATPEERRYFTFAGVRNPLDTLVSHYVRLQRNHRGVYTNPEKFERNGGWVPDAHLERFAFVQQQKASFPQFLRRFFRSVYHEWVLLGYRHFDYVIRFEDLQVHFERVVNLVGLKPVRPLPARNRTGRQDHFKDYYTPDIYDHALRVFGPFMREWGYSFPKEWNAGVIPKSSQLSFKLIDSATNLAARFVCLSPRSSIVQTTKEGLRYLRLT